MRVSFRVSPLPARWLTRPEAYEISTPVTAAIAAEAEVLDGVGKAARAERGVGGTAVGAVDEVATRVLMANPPLTHVANLLHVVQRPRAPDSHCSEECDTPIPKRAPRILFEQDWTRARTQGRHGLEPCTCVLVSGCPSVCRSPCPSLGLAMSHAWVYMHAYFSMLYVSIRLHNACAQLPAPARTLGTRDASVLRRAASPKAWEFPQGSLASAASPEADGDGAEASRPRVQLSPSVWSVRLLVVRLFWYIASGRHRGAYCA